MRKRLSGNGMGRLLGAALLMSLAWTAGAGGVQAEGLSTAYSEVEPNNSFDAATKLTLGTTCAGDVSYENDVDYYSFVLDKPAEVNIRVVTHDNYAGSDSVRLYMEDAKGNKRLIASEGAIGFTGFSSMTLPGGTYYLYLDCYGGELGEYGVEVSILNSSNIEEEWNDTPEQANAKKVGEEYSGDIIGYELDDTDWFSFEIKEKSYIWQEITGFSSFLDNEGLCATLYDENLKELSVLREEDAAFGYATGEQIVVEPGKYYIRVTAQPDYTQSYSIALYANTYVETEKPGDGDNTGSGTGTGNSGNTGSGTGTGSNGNTGSGTDAGTTVKLNKTSAKLAVGGSVQLKLAGTSGKAAWKSSKASVAAVSSSGKVTGKKAGKATITATCDGKKYTCTVTVVPKKQKITYAKSQKAGQVTLKWTKNSAARGYQIRYSTDKSFKKNVKTVTISKNSTYRKTITGLSKGKTYYFQARSYSVSGETRFYGSYSATMKAKVKGTDTAKGKLNKTSAQISVGGSVSLKLTGVSGTVTWKSSKSSVASVSKGKVRGKKVGKATITAVCGGKKYTCTVTVVPKKQKITYAKSQRTGQATLKWQKNTSARGYQIRYSTDKTFKKSVKTAAIGKNSTVKKTLTGLSKGKTYYFQVRSYGVYGGKKLYGDYSSTVKIKIRG